MARMKKATIIFFDEIDAIGGARFDDGSGGDNEVQRTMLELICQLDGFDPRGNIKVIMATNRPDTLDPALMRPGRLDRKIEFSLPDLEVCVMTERRYYSNLLFLFTLVLALLFIFYYHFKLPYLILGSNKHSLYSCKVDECRTICSF